MTGTEVKEGDQVSWNWSGSHPGGTAAEVAEKGEVSIETHRGNTVKKNAEPDNPAVKIERSGNNVVKKASELNVEKPGDKHKEAAGKEKTVGEKEGDKKEGKQNGEGKQTKKSGEKAQTGDKRKADESAEEKKDEEDGDAKKQKTDGAKGDDDKSEPKKKGRPAKKATNGEAKKETKKREPKKAATESGEPRRSARNTKS